MDTGGYSKLGSAIEEVPRGMSEGITSSSPVSPNVRGRGHQCTDWTAEGQCLHPGCGEEWSLGVEDSPGPKGLGGTTLESSPGSPVRGQVLFQS